MYLFLSSPAVFEGFAVKGSGGGRVVAHRSFLCPNQTKLMNGADTAILPAAFALLTAMFMFGGRTRRSFDDASHIAAAVLVLFCLICSLVWIVVTSMNSPIG
jgi:hypothetical protein